MRSHLQGCALKLQTVKSHQAMAEAMSNTAKAMVRVTNMQIYSHAFVYKTIFLSCQQLHRLK